MAQDSDQDKEITRYDLRYSTFRLALIPGLSTNGPQAKEYASGYSLNLLVGYNGALHRGLELGGLANLNKYYARGVQLAGLLNYSGRETQGVQLAGALNLSGGDMQGLQLSGLGNVSRADIQGIQLSGAANWAARHAQGIQLSGALNYAGLDMQGIFVAGAANLSSRNLQGLILSGAANYATREMQGIMLSGLFNYSDSFQGLAASSVNISRLMQGIQIGQVNVVKQGQGIQLGVINYGHHFEGLPVGLISYYKNGRSDIDIWTSDAGFTNIGIKLGTNRIYNMISIGYNLGIGRDVWQLGWSIGSRTDYKKHFTINDFTFFKINEGDWTKDPNTLFKYRFLLGKDFGSGLQIYGGPTINMLISRVPGSSDYTWYRLFDIESGGRAYLFWIGYALGVELF
ncbi:MAG: hypothetical protein R3211_04805 [Balneolaceae bacterium]|nr:hypothetical protein [Balneolaceae bacterium]